MDKQYCSNLKRSEFWYGIMKLRMTLIANRELYLFSLFWVLKRIRGCMNYIACSTGATSA